MRREMLDDDFGVFEVGAFKDGGRDAVGFSLKLQIHNAARLVLAQLADPVWFEAQVLDLCTRSMERVEKVGLPDIEGELPWVELDEGGRAAGAQAMPATRPH